MTRPTWAGLRTGLNLTNIQDLVVLFRKLLVKRAKVLVFFMTFWYGWSFSIEQPATLTYWSERVACASGAT